MRVAVVGPTYPFRGGISHYTTLLCRAMQQRHEVLLVSFTRQYPRILFPGQTDRDRSRKPLDVEGTEYVIDSLNPWTWRRAAQTIRRFEPAVVILQWWVAFWFPHLMALMAMLRRGGGPTIAIICHNAVEHEPSRLKRLLARVVLRQADVLIAHSKAEEATLRLLVGESTRTKAGFLPAFVLPDDGPSRTTTVRRELGLEGQVLLFFGFVREYKGLGVLLDAMPLVLEQRDVTLLIVGEFWDGKRRYLEKIDRLSIGSSVVIVDRYVPNEEVGRYFDVADVVVQPYRSATGSAITQMALGYGRPVVATRVGGIPEVILESGAGSLADPGDAQGLAAAILGALEPTSLRTLRANASAARRRFTWERMAEIILSEEAAS